ncbi:MAG: SDR family oxidoreductase [Victivallales bacterium]|nr:SDR family oxidoreductase [Victivallales bacterium]
MIDNSRILVTGGAGFIGSNLVEDLLSRNNEVVVLDNFSTGKRENLQPFANDRHFTLIEGDIRDYKTCQKAVDGADYVMHEAALGSVPHSIDNPMLATDVNIGGFVNMLYAAKEAKVKCFAYAASSATYGDAEYSPKVEDKIGKPLSPYAITKYVDELYAVNFHDLYGINAVGLRYFNVFGRRQDPYGAYAAVIPIFAMRLLSLIPPVINGDGTFSRDFTHVSNVVLANNLALLSKDEKALNQVYNVACGESTSLNQLFEALKNSLAQIKPEIAGVSPVHGPERIGDIPHSLASIDKISSLLGYKPVMMFEEGIKATAKWYADNLVCK